MSLFHWSLGGRILTADNASVYLEFSVIGVSYIQKPPTRRDLDLDLRFLLNEDVQ